MTIKQIILAAILIRLLIAPFFFHPDIKDINLRLSYLGSNQVLNIYEYLPKDPLTKSTAPDFLYPPLTFFSLGAYQFISLPLLGQDFKDWLFDFSGGAAISNQIFRYLLILNLPFFIFDFLVAFLLYKIVEVNQKKIRFVFLAF